MKKILILLVFLLIPNILFAAPIIVDHNAVRNFNKIPPSYITLAKSMFKVSFEGIIFNKLRQLFTLCMANSVSKIAVSSSCHFTN